MFNKNNTCIIFGTSPFITEFGADNINYLINKYTTVGINKFPIYYNNVDYWIWSDYGDYEDYYEDYIKDKHKLILSKDVYRLESIKYTPEYTFQGCFDICDNLQDERLMMFKTSAHPAINYMILKNFKNIILCGIDLTCEWNHFDSLGDIVRSEKRIERMREKLYSFKDLCNLYTLNEDSDLDIEKINIREL